MPPKKRGGAAAAAAAVASPAAKKRLATTSVKKRATASTKPQDAAAPFHGDEMAGDNAAPTAAQVSGSPGRKEEDVLSAGSAARGGGPSPDIAVTTDEGFDEAHAAAAAGTEGAAVTTTDRHGDAPGGETGVHVAVFGGEVNGSLGGEEKPAPVVRNAEVREDMGVTGAAAGFSEKGEGAHVVAGSEGPEGAASGAAAKGNIASSNEKKEVMMEVEDGPGARTTTPSSMTAAADIVTAADAHPVALGVAELPAPLVGLLQQQMGPPSLSILNGVDELRGITTTLSTFIRCWDRLSHHLDSIQASMDTLSRWLGAHRPQATPATGGKRPPEEMEREADERKKSSVAGEAGGGEEAKKPEQSQKAPPLDLESICEKMLGRNLRRYVVSHMSDVDRLREEVPRALRLAPHPAKLVLNCIGRFYLQGSKAYADPNSPMISVRRACILVLEFFLLSGCPFSGSARLASASPHAATTHTAACRETAEGKMEAEEGKEESSSSVMEEAKVAAFAWKNRLVAEGGVALASAVDALGLALLVASFGIPLEFDSQMMYDVFRLCNMKKKANILRQSPIIVDKLPDIIQDLVQNENYIAAADLACGFGLQEKFPPLDLISSYLIKTNTDIKEESRGQSSITSQKEAAARQLGAYRSVVKCLEDHKLDSSSLTSFKIDEKISELAKDVANLEWKLKERNSKRKAGNAELAYAVKGAAKRPASTPAKATSGGSIPSRPTQDHHGGALSLSRNLYSSSSANRFSGLLDGSGAANQAGNALAPPTGATGSRLAATGTLLGGGGYSSIGNNNGVLASSAESGGVPYLWHHGVSGDGSFRGHGYVGMAAQSSLLMGRDGPASTEGFLQPQPPAPGTGSQVLGSSTGLYGFADNVMENELYYGHSIRSNVLSDSAPGGHR